MYRGCKTKVRSAAGESDSFNVDVGLHQGSALSPYLFIILMDVLTEGVMKEVPESMMFADDIVLWGGREVDMTEYLDTWRKSLEERGMRISRPKTQFMDFNFEKNQQGNREPVNILGEELERVTHFKYLGPSIYGRGRWYGNWDHKACGSRLDKLEKMQRSSVRQKDASETEGESIQNSDQASNAIRGRNVGYTKKRQEKRIEVTEMRMLRWMYGVTRKDKIRNEHIRGTTRVAQASKKITERRLIWYGHVMRKDGEHIYWGKCWGQIYQGKGREDNRKQDGKTHANEICKVLDWERARRRTGRCGEERSSVIPATLHDGKSQRKRRRRRRKWKKKHDRKQTNALLPSIVLLWRLMHFGLTLSNLR